MTTVTKGRRVCVVTGGHLTTCPRMVKAADALAGAGYRVRVVSTCHAAHLAAFDRELHRERTWAWRVVRYDRRGAPAAWLWTGARRRLACVIAQRRQHVPLSALSRALGRTHDELVAAILEEPADLIYGGTVGALAAAAAAGRRSGTPYALDLEDFHAEEHQPAGDGALFNRLARAVMADAARGAAFVTAGSAAIASACQAELGIAAAPIHNVFPLPAAAPARRLRPGSPPRLYWFSQTLGLDRGLQDVIVATGVLSQPMELHIRAAPIAERVAALQQLAAERAPQLRLVFHALDAPGTMVDRCREYDIGISAEIGTPRNRALGLTNKATTYVLAGLPVILTDIPGHRPLASDLGPGALVFAPGDSTTLARALGLMLSTPGAFAAACEASWRAAATRWHWEHPDERGALLSLVGRATA